MRTGIPGFIRWMRRRLKSPKWCWGREVLKEKKELNVIATENNIQPNLLRNWKKEFLEKASAVFNDTREENLKEKLSEERKEKAAYAKKVGQLTMQVDWLKKSEEMLGPDYESKFSPKPPFDD